MGMTEIIVTVCKIKSMEAATPAIPRKMSPFNVKSLQQKAAKLRCKMCRQSRVGVEPYFGQGLDASSFDVWNTSKLCDQGLSVLLDFAVSILPPFPPSTPPVQPSDSPSFVSPQYAEWGEREEDADRSKLKRTTLLPRKFPPNSRPKSISFPDDKLHELPKNTRCQKNTKRTPREYPKNIRRMSEEYPKKVKECPKNTQRTPQKLNFTPGFIRNVIQIQTRKKEMKDFTFFESHFDEMSLWLHMWAFPFWGRGRRKLNSSQLQLNVEKPKPLFAHTQISPKN